MLVKIKNKILLTSENKTIQLYRGCIINVVVKKVKTTKVFFYVYEEEYFLLPVDSYEIIY